MKNSIAIILVILFFIMCSFVQENKESYSQIKSNYETHYFKTSDGLNLRYLKSGEGPALIFQPGWMMPAEVFELQLSQLSKYFKVIVLDPRGHGLSDDCPNDNYVKRRAQDILELVQYEQIESFILAGWSLGVADILSYVDNYNSNKLKALVLIDGPVTTDDEFIQNSWKSILNQLQINKETFKKNFVSGLFSNVQDSVFVNTIHERVNNTYINSSFVALATHIMEPKDYSQIVNNLDIPVLITVAAWTFQLEKFKELKGDITIENFKIHALFIDESERFNNLIIELKAKAFSKE